MSTRKSNNPADLRRALGLNQTDFWAPIGVSQSCGSRYESDREMPEPVRILFDLIHVKRIDIGALKGEDQAVVEYLRNQQPEMFMDLKKQAKAARRA